MPCTYTGSIEGDRAHFAKEALDLRERMLCAICTQLEKEFGVAVTKEILEDVAEATDGLTKTQISSWWKDHKKEDKKKGK